MTAAIRPRPAPGGIIFGLLVAAWLAYAGLFIARTSFVIDGERYFCLFDDAMISLTYARHLARGEGLVWVPGERVEGVTNPAWCVLMAAVHLVGVPDRLTSLVIQILCAGLLLWNLWLTRRLAERLGATPGVATLAALLTAFYLPLNNFSLQGMEVALATPLLTLALHDTLTAGEAGRPGRRLVLLAGLWTLVRIDLVVATLALAVWLGRRGWRLVASAAVVLGLQTLARWGYYGALLPNTYTLKVAGIPLLVRLARGAFLVYGFVAFFNPVLIALAALAPRLTGDRRYGLPLLALGLQLLYSVWVGGDVWEWFGGSNRYVSIALPGLFVALAAAVAEVCRRLFDALARRSARPAPEPVRARLAGGVTTLALLGALVQVNCLRGVDSLNDWLLRRPPLHVADNADHARIGLRVREITSPEATVAVGWAGALPYFADRPGVDLLGKSDAHVAALPPRLNPSLPLVQRFQPGHNKWDYDWSIGRRRPDIVAQGLWEDITPYLGEYEQVVHRDLVCWARRDSPHVRWDLVTVNPRRAWAP